MTILITSAISWILAGFNLTITASDQPNQYFPKCIGQALSEVFRSRQSPIKELRRLNNV
jgi:hypothetical protein